MSRKSFFLWIIAVIFFGIHLDYLSQRIVRIEGELKSMGGISSELFAVQSKIAMFQGILSQDNSAKAKRIHVFKSTQNADSVDDALISNAPGQADYNWGANPTMGVGYDGNDNSYRTLIKFNELKEVLPENIQIIAATLYLKQLDNDRNDDRALRETFELWEVEKKWGEGNKTGSRAQQGEVTWKAAAQGILNWNLPGCSDDGNDVHKYTLLATTGPNVNDGGNDWVAFSFTPPGMTRLERMLHNKNISNYGFLIQSEAGTNKKNTFVSFYSSDYQAAPQRPYIEIIYIERDNSL